MNVNEFPSFLEKSSRSKVNETKITTEMFLIDITLDLEVKTNQNMTKNLVLGLSGMF